MEGRERERELDFDLGATPLLLSLSLGEVAAFTRKSLLSSDRQSPTLSWFYCFIAVSRASCMTELQAIQTIGHSRAGMKKRRWTIGNSVSIDPTRGLQKARIKK
jgi:hypothetical protein